MSTPLAIVLTLFIGGLALWALLAWQAELLRRRRLVSAGRPLGLRLDVNDPFDLAESHFGLCLFTRGHSRLAWNVLNGQIRNARPAGSGERGAGPANDGLAARLFEYQYETGSGKNRRTHRWQVAIVHTDLTWPALLCEPAERHDPLEVVFGLEPVAFEVQPFASRFRVACENADFAFRFLHAQLCDLLVSHPNVAIETQADAVAVYRPGPVRPDEAVQLLELACQVVKSLPPSLREEMRSNG